MNGWLSGLSADLAEQDEQVHYASGDIIKTNQSNKSKNNNKNKNF